MVTNSSGLLVHWNSKHFDAGPGLAALPFCFEKLQLGADTCQVPRAYTADDVGGGRTRDIATSRIETLSIWGRRRRVRKMRDCFFSDR